MALLAMVGGCGSKYPPPAGYTDACYGGDYERRIDGLVPKLRLRVPVSEGEWPLLERLLDEFGKPHGFRVFDSSGRLPGLHELDVSVCSSGGLLIHVGKRIWEKGAPDPDPDHATIYLYQYDPAFDWKRVADDLTATVRERWMHPSEVIDGSDSRIGAQPSLGAARER